MINCRNCGRMCGAVEFIDTPFCCIGCEEDYYEAKKLHAKRMSENA